LGKSDLLYRYAGKDVRVTKWQAYALERLDQARAAILGGATSAIALVEITPEDDVYRAWWVAASDEDVVELMHRNAELQRAIRQNLWKSRGNVPEANKSKLVN
jgi:hypothetical protein